MLTLLSSVCFSVRRTRSPSPLFVLQDGGASEDDLAYARHLDAIRTRQMEVSAGSFFLFALQYWHSSSLFLYISCHLSLHLLSICLSIALFPHRADALCLFLSHTNFRF